MSKIEFCSEFKIFVPLGIKIAYFLSNHKSYLYIIFNPLREFFLLFESSVSSLEKISSEFRIWVYYSVGLSDLKLTQTGHLDFNLLWIWQGSITECIDRILADQDADPNFCLIW